MNRAATARLASASFSTPDRAETPGLWSQVQKHLVARFQPNTRWLNRILASLEAFSKFVMMSEI